MAFGAVAHLGECIVCNDGVASSILVSSTNLRGNGVEVQYYIAYIAQRN